MGIGIGYLTLIRIAKFVYGTGSGHLGSDCRRDMLFPAGRKAAIAVLIVTKGAVLESVKTLIVKDTEAILGIWLEVQRSRKIIEKCIAITNQWVLHSL